MIEAIIIWILFVMIAWFLVVVLGGGSIRTGPCVSPPKGVSILCDCSEKKNGVCPRNWKR